MPPPSASGAGELLASGMARAPLQTSSDGIAKQRPPASAVWSSSTPCRTGSMTKCPSTGSPGSSMPSASLRISLIFCLPRGQKTSAPGLKPSLPSCPAPTSHWQNPPSSAALRLCCAAGTPTRISHPSWAGRTTGSAPPSRTSIMPTSAFPTSSTSQPTPASSPASPCLVPLSFPMSQTARTFLPFVGTQH